LIWFCLCVGRTLLSNAFDFGLPLCGSAFLSDLCGAGALARDFFILISQSNNPVILSEGI